MSKNTRPSIDGFIPRRGSQLESPIKTGLQPKSAESGLSPAAERDKLKGSSLKHEHAGGLTRAEIDNSLRSIEDESRSDKKRRKQTHKKRRLGKRILIAIAVMIALVGGIIFVKFVIASGSVFKGDLFGFVQSKPLKQDANGRSNLVIFGTAEDSEGGQHGGANLTDSIMVLSIDQTKKDAYMLSLPRDLWVSYEETCTVGNQGKLNAAYFCASDDGANEEAGTKALQSKIKDITGLDVQYYVHVNFGVVVEAVDAVGGVDVKIETDDPRGILDRNFDWQCDYKCYYVKYTQGQQVHLDGEHALALARARNAQGGYGLTSGNFSREENQQKILVALRNKAMSAGTLTNLTKVTSLIDTFGKNLRTNFETSEIRTLMSLAQDVPTDKIQSLTLVDEEAPLVMIGNYGGQSIVRPTLGLLNYSQIIKYVRESVASTPLTKEKAQVMVLNGSGISGKAQEVADALSEKGITVAEVGNAPEGTYGRYEIYATGGDKPVTQLKLEELYKVKISKGLPPIQTTGVDFVIIVGAQG